MNGNLLNHLHEVVSDKGNTRDRFVCLECVTLITPVHAFENRPFQSGQRCFSDILASQVWLCFTPFFIHSKGSSESKSGPLSNSHNNPNMARPTMVGLKMSEKITILLTALKSLTRDSAVQLNALLMKNSLLVVAWTISDRVYLQKKFQKGLPT